MVNVSRAGAKCEFNCSTLNPCPSPISRGNSVESGGAREKPELSGSDRNPETSGRRVSFWPLED